MGFPGGSAAKNPPANAGDLGSIPGLGRSTGEENSYPLQYSGLENSTGCIVYGVAKSWARLSDFHQRLKEQLTTIKNRWGDFTLGQVITVL